MGLRNTKIKNLTKRVVIFSIPILLFGWFVLGYLTRNLLPTDLIQDIFFWIILYSVILLFILDKIKIRQVLFSGLILTTLGAGFSILGNINMSELLLRFGYVFLLVGCLASIIETVKHPSKDEK